MTLTADQVRDLLHYDPETGIFTRINSRRTDWIGRKAGNLNTIGYIGVSIKNRIYLAHRLAFLLMTGRWPTEIDHVNGSRDDNRWINLREVTRSQNAQNSRKKRGILLKGVHLHRRKTDKPFAAQIRTNGKRFFLGYHYTEQEAHATYCEAAAILNGEYARTK